MHDRTTGLDALEGFPLMHALFGRRARRFGLGMELPSGPLAFRSRFDAVPLSRLERSILVAAGTGVTGWNFGVPFTPRQPTAHGHYTGRFTGRTGPTMAGVGTPMLFHTDDDGVYLTDTRDATPPALDGDPGSWTERIAEHCAEHTVRLSAGRLDLPAEPPHMIESNLWMANAPGSTLFMPVADASEQFLGLLAIYVGNGYVVWDDEAGRPAGNLEPFVRNGVIDEAKQVPLSALVSGANDTLCMELAMMGHSIVLTMQAMGLGGLFFTGLNRYSVLGAFADAGIAGLGFRFVRDDRWTLPNPVGLDGRFEALCPPYVTDMRHAVEVYVERKFGPGGAYDPSAPGPWQRSPDVKRSVAPYDDAFVDCLATVAQYVFDVHGKFPGTSATMVLPCFVQAQHIDTEFYDEHYASGAYLRTHAEHAALWHPD